MNHNRMHFQIVLITFVTIISSMLSLSTLPKFLRGRAGKVSFKGSFCQSQWKSLSSSSNNSNNTTNPVAKGFGQPSSPISNSVEQQKLQELLADYQKSRQKRIFEDQLKFPTIFPIKIIGESTPTFAQDMVKIISQSINETVELPYTVKEQGKFLSITVKPTFQSATQLYATYDSLGKDSRVKFIL